MDRVWSDRSITALKLLVALLSLGPFITNGFSVCTTTGRQGTSVSGPIVSFLGMSRDWIDEVEYLDDDPIDDGPPVSPDMKYLPRNVMRQNKNFVAMRQAGGKEITNDIYVREPKSEVFYFVGKAAQVSDVTTSQAVSRQWSLITTHAANLRPLDLFPYRASLEVWTAPGDSEMDVAYNNPDLVFQKMERSVEGADVIKSNLIGFQGEMYERGEEGFRTWRKDDGSAGRPQIQAPNQEEKRPPSDDEMKQLEELLEGQDINALYEEQRRREGTPIDD